MVAADGLQSKYNKRSFLLNGKSLTRTTGQASGFVST